tara:strand:- start:3099 stop:3983 length:885 start_codon:yes stop_codon:yes gene_type:complete
MDKQIFWVASYPKSGNTLLRAIVSSLFFTKDGCFNFKLLKTIVLFEEMSRLSSCTKTSSNEMNIRNTASKLNLIYENLFEMQSKKNLGFKEDFAFFKTHFNANYNGKSFLIKEFIRGILYIYRDPRDICLSWARHANVSNRKSLNFLLDKNASINWTDIENFRNYNENAPVYLSDWQNHFMSWTENDLDCPFFLISYENLVYDKKNTVLKLLDFFKHNYNIEFSNKDEKINNIIATTDFENLKKMEKDIGFKEATNKNFFAIGKKEQWRKDLTKEEIDMIENKFSKCMIKLKYI